MNKNRIITLLSGILFGLGLCLSGMVNPHKVLNFLDVLGQWDPSLAFVMASALIITMPAYYFILKRNRAVFSDTLFLPEKTQIDYRLIAGASCFGIGWGIAGYCPGPAVAAIVLNWSEAAPFLLAMWVGGYLHVLLQSEPCNPY